MNTDPVINDAIDRIQAVIANLRSRFPADHETNLPIRRAFLDDVEKVCAALEVDGGFQVDPFKNNGPLDAELTLARMKRSKAIDERMAAETDAVRGAG